MLTLDASQDDVGWGRLLQPTLVSREEFDAAVCNGCGQCCERFFLPLTPLEMVGATGRSFMSDFTAWMWSLDFIEDREGGGIYSCRKFVRLSPDVGVCTDHANRPHTCRDFPYGRPLDNMQPGETYHGCPFAVEIAE